MKIYFMGIAGTAMGNAALLARAAGHEVIGADTGVYPPMSDVLAAAGITFREGYDPEKLRAEAPDLVVVGNAQSRGNPEIEWLLSARALPFTSLPALLHDVVLRRRDNIVVAGTHGKTTTTALTAFLLRENGRDPGFLIGGAPLDPPVGNHLGDPAAPFVIEGDEYDSAFFDKRSKFIHYAPRIAVFNNLEFDHADIFRDLADVQRTFSHLARIVPADGCIILNGDDDNLRALGAFPWTRTLRVGTGADNDLRLADFAEDAAGTACTLVWRGSAWARLRLQIPGLYNARNAAMAAAAAALSLLPREADGDLAASGLDLAPLTRFRGVRRRQEVRAARAGLTVIEDFGHHPTAIAGALDSFRNRFPGARLTAVFEPRSNTARTNVLQPAFTEALGHADEVFIGAVNRADKLRAEDRFDVEQVLAALRAAGAVAETAPTNAGLLEKLAALVATSPATPERPRVVVFFSNGDFDGIIARFAAQVAG
ncbi:MAG: Mur ligase family protein [Verrucomicrobiota bacterium]